MKAAKPAKTASKPVASEIEHVTSELYKQNLELAERNKTLQLLRKIDEIVLSETSTTSQASQRILQTLLDETTFITLAAIFLSDKQRKNLVMDAFVFTSTRGDNDFDANEIIKKLKGLKSPLRRKGVLTQAAEHRKIRIERQFSNLFSLAPNRHIAQELDPMLDVKTVFVCPLVARGELIGILTVGTRKTTKELTLYQRNLIDRLIGVVGIAIDNKILYEEIQEATKRLRIQNFRLKELDEAKDEFISMASHQLRTPLTSIKGYLSMLREGDAGKLAPKQSEFTELAYTSAERMVFLIADMLNVSRINTGKLVIEKVSLDLDAVVKDEILQLKRVAAARNVVIKYQASETKLPQLLLDEGKLRQVIMNLIDNAIYYAPDSTVEVKIDEINNKARFRVIDHGIGVPENEKKRLFAKFYRAVNAQKARPDGTGLGLFMAKMVVEMQGGSIIFESAEGKGSTFGFEFPLLTTAPNARTATKPKAAAEPVR